MKLWKKLSLLASGILIATVTLCCALLLLQSRNSILNATYAQAKSKQANLATSFSQMTSYYAGENDLMATRYSLARYCFERFADETAVLIQDGELIRSAVSILPTAYLPVESAAQVQFSGEIGGRNIYIVGSEVSVKASPYLVYVVMDITAVYNDIAAMAWRFGAIGLVAILLGTGLILLLVRRATKPLMALRSASTRIAGGNYGERAAIETRNEIGELAEDFNAMAAAIERHVEELTETMLRQRLFIGGVTHEFKTPLTTMLLNADTLQNTFLTEEERQQSLQLIESQCNWLERLTQKLLKLITLGEGIEKKPVSVPLLLERVQESMARMLQERGTPMEIDCRADKLMMDADLMQSALVNLLDNASKASRPGQAVEMKAYGDCIEVWDGGCGIPQAELGRIAEPFYMVDKSRSKALGGSGLGLALVREIVLAHGATLEIESKEGEGTVARIKFQR